MKAVKVLFFLPRKLPHFSRELQSTFPLRVVVCPLNLVHVVPRHPFSKKIKVLFNLLIAIH